MAFLVHLGSVLGGVFGYVALKTFEQGADLSFTTLVAGWVQFIEHAIQELATDPLGFRYFEFPSAYLLCFLGGFPITAVVFSSWGAIVEPLRASFRAALRATWLCTPHAVLCLLLALFAEAHLIRINRAWWRANPLSPPPTAPQQPSPGALPLPPNEVYPPSGYLREVEEYQSKNRAHIAKQPPIMRYADVVGAAAWSGLGLWFLFSLLRALGIRRTVDPIIGTSLCDRCGYDLQGLASDGNCPECGLPVAESLGTIARPGAPWEHRKSLGLAKAWWGCAWNAFFHSKHFGRQLRFFAPQTAHRSFLCIHLPVVGIAAALVLELDRVGRWGFEEYPSEMAIRIVTVSAPFGIALGVYFTCMAATAIAILGRLFWRRNLMPGSMQMACYLTPMLTVAILVGGLWHASVLLIVKPFLLRQVAIPTVKHFVPLYFLWLMPIMALMWRYGLALFRGTAAMRHANF